MQRIAITSVLLLVGSSLIAQKAPPWDLAVLNQSGQNTTYMANPGGGFCGVPVEYGDYDGDGFVDYAVAPPLTDGGPGASRVNSGACFIIRGTGAIAGVLDLATAPPGQPLLTVWGAAANDNLGTELYSADLNGDNNPELILGASGADPNGIDRAGSVYIIWGGMGFTGLIDLAAPPVSGVTIINGINTADRLGFWVEAGDVNGDGIDDLLMSSDDGDGPNNTTQDRGEAYVIYGGATLPAVIDLGAPPPGISIVTIYGDDNADQLGSCMHSVDLDADGFEEIIVSAALNRAIGGQTGAGIAGGDGPTNNRSGCGDSYIIWGSATLPSVINLDTDKTAMLAAGTLTIIFGANSQDYLGEEFSSGYIDGDIYPDLVVGAITGDGFQNANANAGEAVVLWGGPQLRGQTLDMALFPAGTSTLFGEDNGDIGGDTLSVGDVNGDGYGDIYFAVPNADIFRTSGIVNNAGELVIIFGGPVRFPSQTRVSELRTDTDWPTRLVWGADTGDLLGYSMEGGDIDSDGHDDILPNAMRGDGFANGNGDAGEVTITSGAVFSRGIVTVVTPAAIGTTVGFHLVAEPNQDFVAAFSLGLAPPQMIPGIGTIHLADDFLLQLSLSQVSPFDDLTGVTGATGIGAYSLGLPALPALVGLRIYTSFVSVDVVNAQVGTVGYTTSFVITN